MARTQEDEDRPRPGADLPPPPPPPSPPAAQAVGLEKTYGSGQAAVRALAGVDLVFDHGHFTAVMGPSGSGKSTLMHCMAGLDRPTAGRVFVGGSDIGAMDDASLTEMRRDRVGFVFQSFNLVPTLTAGENITLPADLAGTKVDKEWFDYLVGHLGIGDRLSHRPSEMSGGQQQRCACARALINRPDLVFADEPTGNLDSNSTSDLLGFLRRSVTEFGQSIAMVTHDPHGASYADRVVFLADGNVVDDLAAPTADTVLEHMRTLGTGTGTVADVWRVTIKGLLAHKLRLVLTALAIVLGVTFIAGTFVLTDTLNSTFNTLFGNIYQNVDFQVRGVAQLGSGGGATRNPVPESLLASVRAVPGVGVAEGTVGGYAQFISHDGKAIATGGAPTIGVSWDPAQQLSALRLATGAPPTTRHDVVMDLGTAEKYGFSVGQQVRILLRGPPQTFTVTGLARFGTANNLAGATLAAFQLPTAQRILGEVGKFDAINVVAQPGADKAQVQRAIARALPGGVEVVTSQTVVNEQTSQISQALGFFNTALLVFGFIALFVGGFTILNTFSITVGQRTRELALLRIVGASRRQVFRSVLGEAAIVGLVSSLVGLGLGVLAALGLEALLSGFGVTLPSGPLVFEARTVIVCVIVGVGVTLVAAISPARRAVRIAPVAAVSEQQTEAEIPLRRRVTWGGVITALGVIGLAYGLTKPAIAFVGLGALLGFVGVALLAPVVARPMASGIGRPLARLLGTSGRLGRENSMRSPRRTAQTASALMVGLALVSAIAVFGASLSRSATASVQQAIRADIIVSPPNNAQSGFSTTVAPRAAMVPGVTATSTVYQDQFELRRQIQTLTAVSTHHLAQTVNLQMTEGTSAALARGQLLIDTKTADAKNLAAGDVVPVKFAKTGNTFMRIGGVYKANALIGSYVVGDRFFLAHFDNELPIAVLLKTDGSPAVEQQVKSALSAYPNLKIQSRAEFEKSQEQQVNVLLGLVYALLGLAVIIALIGIVNTLMLSVFERTHEIGLLRAVGMKRRQIRAMIRSESVILAVFGALIGIVVGTLLGVALVASLRSQGLTDLVVPVSNLVIFLVLAALLGLVAASWPARRAAKLDVLAAIAAE